MSRVYNFSAGPAVLPVEVLQEAADEMLDYRGTGMSVMEMSHRSKAFDLCLIHIYEQGASHAADGYARATGKVGVCLATSGPVSYTHLDVYKRQAMRYLKLPVQV